MDDFDQFEQRLAAALRSDADTSVARFEPATIASAAVASTQRGPRRIAQGFTIRPTSNRWPLAAAIVIGILMVGALLPAIVGRPSPTPSAAPNASLPGVVPPSSTPGVTAPNPSAFPRTSGVWIATGSMLTPRSGHTAVRLLDGRVLVAGGYPGDNPDLAVTSAELYDPDTGTWTATGNMLKFHAGFPATLLRDGRVLVGDVDDPTFDNPVLGAEVYDPASGTWAATGRMVKANPGTATLLRDGRVLVTGSGGSSSQLYDPDSGTWASAGKMVTPSNNHAATLLLDGKVLVVGGFDGGNDNGFDSAELYDPATGIWTAVAPMHGAKGSITATLLPDGKVLVVGETMWRPPTPPELYDPATGTWTVIGDPARPGTSYGSAVLLSDGMVLVTIDTSAVLYDPGTESWTATGTMLAQHNGAPSAALLLDGTVLVAGGFGCSSAVEPVCTETSSAELYVPAGVSPPSAVLALPSPAPTPSPTPSPTPVPPQAGPVPPGARPWKLTVSNDSARPATLFVADGDERGLMGQLVGSVTPNVVPPGATVEATFLLPAKGVEGWSIYVNPGPNNGGLIGWIDEPLAGEIHIGPDGQQGWLPEDQRDSP